MKKCRCVRLPPDLSDGERSTANVNPLEIGDAVIRWMCDRHVGSKVTLEIIELTDEEMDALPSIYLKADAKIEPFCVRRSSCA